MYEDFLQKPYRCGRSPVRIYTDIPIIATTIYILVVTLKNETFLVEISPEGAELQRLYSPVLQLDYLWSGDAAFWSKRSPVLFPIVGQIKDNTYCFFNKEYHLNRHGFARGKIFIIEHQDEAAVTFLLEQDEDTLTVFPFHFQLRIHYRLEGQTIVITYDVNNTNTDTLYFSIGGHPAFATNIAPDAGYDDYYLELEHAENAPRYTLQNGLIGDPVTFLEYESHIPLSHKLFYKDAIVLKHLKSTHISLKNRINKHGITLNWDNFPYLGIWAAKDAPFVCVEPWWGIADAVDHNQELIQKEGIIMLPADQRWQREWRITCF